LELADGAPTAEIKANTFVAVADGLYEWKLAPKK
jgi:hypothetical protein